MMQLNIDGTGTRKVRVTVSEQKKLYAAVGVASAYSHCAESPTANKAIAAMKELIEEIERQNGK